MEEQRILEYLTTPSILGNEYKTRRSFLWDVLN